VPEIRYLIARLLLKPIAQARFVMAWSRWRQQHQSAAANAHRKRQNKLQL
jgi:response regulator of citrate/malate metabolism